MERKGIKIEFKDGGIEYYDSTYVIIIKGRTKDFNHIVKIKDIKDVETYEYELK